MEFQLTLQKNFNDCVLFLSLFWWLGSQQMTFFKTDHGLRREENKVEFLEGRFLDEQLPFLHKKKAEHSFELSLSNFVF